MSKKANILIAGITGVAFILFLIFVYQPYASKQEKVNKFADAVQKSYLLKDPVKKIPPFSFINQNGITITNKDVEGKVYIADFIYTSCESSCPLITKELTRVHKAINKSEPFRILSFSLDPARDSVPALKAFAEKFQAIDSIWFFLTGPEEELYNVGKDGFMQTVLDGSDSYVHHSQKVVLVDKRGMIRGFYNGLDSMEMQLLIRDIDFLIFKDETNE